MTKFFMILAMAALIAATVFAGWNNKVLNDHIREIDRLKTEWARLNSNLQESEEKLKNVEVALDSAKTNNQQVKAELSLTNDELTRKNREMQDLTAKFDGMKSRLQELELIKDQLNGKTIEDVQQEYAMLQKTLTDKQQERRDLEQEIIVVQGDVEKNEQRISQLEEEELLRRKKIALNAMEAMVIAINRDYGFVIVNAGSDVGVTPDSSLLVQRDVDRIGRLRIVSVEPSVTVADIIPGSVTPGAQIKVRDRVIFEQVQ